VRKPPCATGANASFANNDLASPDDPGCLVRPVKQLPIANEALLPAAQGGRGADDQQTGGLADESLLPVGRANRGAIEGLLRWDVASLMLVV
jgi:hypothetical protein